MEADDLDSLIADSIAGVQSTLDGDRKAAPPAACSETAASHASEAVQALQKGPERSDKGDGQMGEEFFANLVKTFQDENFQKAMAEVLQVDGKDKEPAAAATGAAAPMAVADGAAQPSPSATPAALAPASSSAVVPAASSGSGGASGSDGGGGADDVQDFMKNFMQSFESAVGSDDNFAKSLGSLMTSVIPSELMCEPLQQIADQMEPWLKQHKSLPASERARYEAQLRLYRKIVSIYKAAGDPMDDAARAEVQRLFSELHSLGQPPDEIMSKITPKESEGEEGSFEDFVKSMGLADGLGPGEQDLLKKLTEDPEELTKVMQDMCGKLGDSDNPEEACKQQ